MKTKNKSSFFGVILCIALVIGLSMTVACGGGSSASTGPPPPQSITITTTSLPPGNAGAAYSAFVDATGGTGQFTWKASAGLPPGLTLDTSGLPTNPGVLEGTPTAKGTFNFTATVTDTAGVSASKTFSVTIGAALPLSITTTSPLPDGTVNNPYLPPFSPTLQATGGLQPYTWSLTTGSSLPSNLTLDTSGNISGTPTAAGTFSFSVVVSDAETPPLTASATFSFTIHTQLFGQNVFLFNGSDANGAVVAGGSFTADDTGNITEGVEDINRHVPGPATNVPFSGSYSIGKDNRGTLTFTSSLGTSTFAFAIHPTSNLFHSSGTARFIEFDTNGTRGSGVIEKSTAACSLASITGDFAFGISGDDFSNGRVAMAGRFHGDGAGNLSSGVLDENDAGSLSSDVAWTGTYAPPTTSSPRCTATFTPAGLPARNFALYPISSSEAFLVEVDPVAASIPLTAGRVLPQAGPSGPGTFTNASLGGPSVAGLTGFSAGASAPDVSLVFFSPDGMGNVTITQDENKGGVVTTGTVLKGTYNVSSNGRVTLTTGKNPPVLYLVSGNEAFMLGTDDAATLGVLEPQGGSALSLSNATITGNFFLGTATPASTNVSDLSGIVTFDGVSALTGTLDESTPAAHLADQALTGTYSVTNTPVNGHGTLTITPAGGPPANFVFLGSVRSSSININGFTRSAPGFLKLVAIPSDAMQTNPGVLILDP